MAVMRALITSLQPDPVGDRSVEAARQVHAE
jgi:hypothetical protein